MNRPALRFSIPPGGWSAGKRILSGAAGRQALHFGGQAVECRAGGLPCDPGAYAGVVGQTGAHQTGAPFALQVRRSRVEECALTFALAPIHVGGEVRERLSGICWARDAFGVRILL